MTLYAAKTTVPVERSRAAIEKLLTRYGATKVAIAWGSGRSTVYVYFEVHDRKVQFDMRLPDRRAPEIRCKPLPRSPGRFGRLRTEKQAEAAYDQECRRRWRALLIVIQAKIEAVRSGITSFDVEFLAHILLPGTGDTVANTVIPQIADAYATGAEIKKLGPHR